MVQNNKKLSIISFIVLIFFACNQESSKRKENKDTVNAAMFQNTDTWDNSVFPNFNSNTAKKIKLTFLNNPYRFNEYDYNLIVYLNNDIIFKGKFNQFIDVFVSNDFFGKNVVPGLQVFEKNTEYNFIHKANIFLGSNTKHLYVVFLPDNELVESCYLFGQDEPL